MDWWNVLTVALGLAVLTTLGYISYKLMCITTILRQQYATLATVQYRLETHLLTSVREEAHS